MTINFNPADAAPGSLPGRLDRQDAGARQDRWMSQLERALFADDGKKRTGEGAPDAQPAPAELPVTQDADPAPAVQHDTVRPKAAGHGGAKVLAHVQAETFQPAAAALVAHGVHLELGAATSGQTVAAPGAAAVIAPRSAAPGAMDADASMPAPLRAPAAMSGPGAMPALRDGAAPAAGEAAGADSADARPGQAEQFDKRLLHVYLGNDGVHAYIRDAELGGAQLRAVALALSSQLGANGQALAALTVNGKRVDPRSAPAAGLPGQDASAFSLMHTPVRKGNS